MKWIKTSLFISVFIPQILSAGGISYTVEFDGLQDSDALEGIKSSSELVALRKRSPSSINALRFRAQSDVPNLIKALHAYGYYEGEVHIEVQEWRSQAVVTVKIMPGPLYRIEQFEVHLVPKSTELAEKKYDLEKLDISLGMPASSLEILRAEGHLLQIFSENGYPLASLEKRSIVADGDTKKVKVNLTYQMGCLAHFGPVRIEGTRSVKPLYIEQKELWKEGQAYNQTLVEETETALMDSGLFSSASISHADACDSSGQLPMKIEVSENKHRSISLGASYQTYYGPGVSLGWENRNVGGMGKKLSLQAEIAQRSHSGTASYLIPNFHSVGQDFLTQAEVFQEKITAYSEWVGLFFNRFDKKISPRLRFSVALREEYVQVNDSVHNGDFFLIEVPISLRWSSADNLLNPTRGVTIEYRVSPALNTNHGMSPYLTQVLIQKYYLPLSPGDYLVLAQKITLGSIVSSGLDSIPVPKRFLGGSDDNLRGYRYRSVSPLHRKKKPIGGRSEVFYTLELRTRPFHSFGIVPFFDMGNVYLEQLPTFQKKWLKSLGIGLRYYSFFGPLRLDVAFPLDRRKHLDTPFWIFVSIGQMF